MCCGAATTNVHIGKRLRVDESVVVVVLFSCFLCTSSVVL